MGYDLHITRRKYWFGKEQHENDISLDEWLTFIHSSSSELELVDAHGVKVAEADARSQVPPGFCEWTAHPQNRRPWFDYYHGEISTKNPDEPTIRKMILIAREINAKVQGNEGELYELTPDNKITSREIGARLEDKTSGNEKKPWWRFW